MEPKINFHFLYHSFSFKNRKQVKRFLIQLFKQEGKEVGHINYVFCSDDYLLSINQTYLKHNTYTDIVTFDLSEDKNIIISDIYISIERVKENAQTFHIPFKNELLRVIFHGALHLCGYKDKKKSDIILMRMKEEEYLKQYFVSRDTVSKGNIK